MSAKTGKQIEGDVYGLLRDSPLAAYVNGGVYRSGTRPRDSLKEDIVVGFVSGNAGEDMDEGRVVVNVYIPDIRPYGDGVYVEDGARAEQIEAAAQEWALGLGAGRSDYLFSLAQTVSTYEEPETHERFVSVRLAYRRFSR